MRFVELEVAGAYLVELEPQADERGFFARAFCEREFAACGLPTHYPQCNLSRNTRRGTLRGMHYSVAPSQESKVVRCVRGAIHDVLVDVRPGSSSFGRWVAAELSAENGTALFIPPGVGHGFLTLAEHTDVFYQMGDVFQPDAARGFRWDDPAFAIRWPEAPSVISPRDASYPDFHGA
jgi:dTDP-4-dehydrorhamnose 3,5-epimerase